MLQRFSGGSPSVRNKLNAAVDELNPLTVIRGDEKFIAVKRGPGGSVVSLNIAAVLARVPRTPPAPLVPLKLTAGADGSNWYAGKAQLAPTSDSDPTADLTLAALGTNGGDCFIANPFELGRSGHLLVDVGALPMDAIGVPLPATADGTPCYMVVAFGGVSGTSQRYADVTWDGTDLKQNKNAITYLNGVLIKVDDPTTNTIDTPDPECPAPA